MSNRAKNIALVTIGVFVGGLLSLIAAAVISEARMVYATPERRSAFLKTYTPDAVVKPFTSPRWSADFGSSDVSEAGQGRAEFKKMFDARMAIRSEDRKALTAALSQDIINELSNSGGWVYEKKGDANVGHRFKYVAGKSTGTISLTPVQQLDPDHLGGLYGDGPKKESLQFLHPDEVPVEFTISIEETWTRGR